MGDAKRRKQLDSTFGKPPELPLLEQWSLVLIVGIDDLLSISVWQGDRAVCEEQWLKATKAERSALERIEKNGFVSVAKPGVQVNLALVKPETVKTYVSDLWTKLRAQRLKPVLTVSDGQDAIQPFFALWNAASG